MRLWWQGVEQGRHLKQVIFSVYRLAEYINVQCVHIEQYYISPMRGGVVCWLHLHLLLLMLVVTFHHVYCDKPDSFIPERGEEGIQPNTETIDVTLPEMSRGSRVDHTGGNTEHRTEPRMFSPVDIKCNGKLIRIYSPNFMWIKCNLITYHRRSCSLLYTLFTVTFQQLYILEQQIYNCHITSNSPIYILQYKYVLF